jgi:hypothetical protein
VSEQYLRVEHHFHLENALSLSVHKYTHAYIHAYMHAYLGIKQATSMYIDTSVRGWDKFAKEIVERGA